MNSDELAPRSLLRAGGGHTQSQDVWNRRHYLRRKTHMYSCTYYTVCTDLLSITPLPTLAPSNYNNAHYEVTRLSPAVSCDLNQVVRVARGVRYSEPER